MAQIAFIDVAKLLDDAGFPGGQASANGIAVVTAESNRNPAAFFINDDQWKSKDRGLWEINDHWHPEVTDACAYDPLCSTKAALKISNGGTDYSPWSTWKNGAYGAHIEAAKVALDGWARIKTLNATIARIQFQLTQSQSQYADSSQKLAVALTQLSSTQAALVDAQTQLTEMTAKLGGEVELVNQLQDKISQAMTILGGTQ